MRIGAFAEAGYSEIVVKPNGRLYKPTRFENGLPVYVGLEKYVSIKADFREKILVLRQVEILKNSIDEGSRTFKIPGKIMDLYRQRRISPSTLPQALYDWFQESELTRAVEAAIVLAATDLPWRRVARIITGGTKPAARPEPQRRTPPPPWSAPIVEPGPSAKVEEAPIAMSDGEAAA